MYTEIVAVTFENAQKHINALRGQKHIPLSVKTSRMYTNCQGLQRQPFFTKTTISTMKWPVKLSLNSSIPNLIKIGQRLFTYYIHVGRGTGRFQ